MLLMDYAFKQGTFFLLIYFNTNTNLKYDLLESSLVYKVLRDLMMFADNNIK